MTHLSTEGIEIEVSDMPVRDELAELRTFVESYVVLEADSRREYSDTWDRDVQSNSRGREIAAKRILVEIDRLIAARGK